MKILVFITTANKKQARAIASALVSKGLAACVNIIPKIDSIFTWKNKLEQEQECLLLVKSKKSLMPKLIKLVKSLHSYSVPEIIAIPIIAGNKDYLNWLDESTR
jgi:periplasmic divalent cation tolerance protein